MSCCARHIAIAARCLYILDDWTYLATFKQRKACHVNINILSTVWGSIKTEYLYTGNKDTSDKLRSGVSLWIQSNEQHVCSL